MSAAGVAKRATSETGATALGYAAISVLALASLILVMLIPFTKRPVPNHTAGIVFGPGFDSRTSVSTVVSADPRARLLEIRWRGRLLFVNYQDATFPQAVGKAGALYSFDAIAAGCHITRGAPSRANLSNAIR